MTAERFGAGPLEVVKEASEAAGLTLATGGIADNLAIHGIRLTAERFDARLFGSARDRGKSSRRRRKQRG